MKRKWIGMMMAAALTLGLTACGGSPANELNLSPGRPHGHPCYESQRLS